MSFDSPRDLVRRGAESHGERLAVISSDERLTYRQLADRTGALAADLKQAGVGPGVQVALLLPNSIAYVVWFFGVLEAGGITVPLAPAMAAAEAAALLDHSGVHFLAAADGASPPAVAEDFQPVKSGRSQRAALWRAVTKPPLIQTTPWTADGYVVRQFSSGSTGRAKHILRTEASVFESYWHVCETIGLEDGERFLGVAPFYHSSGAGTLYAALHLCGTLSVLPRFLPADVLEAAKRDRPTVFMATPSMIGVLASCRLEEGDEKSFESLKLCSSATGQLRKPVHDAFFERFGLPVRNKYGSNETGTVSIDLDDGFEEGRAGLPYDGVEIGIFDDDGNPCAAGIQGRIGVRSPATSQSYVGEPEITALTFRDDGFVFPGDVGYRDDAGRLYVLGRSDIINIGGYKVDQLEVERVIREMLPVRDVFVLAGVRAGLPVIRAVVEADPAKVTRAMVIEACRARLSSYKVPALVEVRERLERDANGKVLRASLDP